MNYLLVRVHYDKRVASLEPLGLEYLSACIKAEGHKAYIHDEGLYGPFFRYKRLADKIKKLSIDFVGVTIMANKAWYDLEIIKKIKQDFPNIKVMVGGPEVILNHQDFMTDDIDFVQYDNGLESFRLAVRNNFAPEIMKDCKGHAYKIDGKWYENEKSAPISDYGIWPDRTIFYENRRKYRVIAKGNFSLAKTTQSCPHQCKFCVSRRINDCTYTERDVDDAIAELESIDNDKIFIVDDDFLVNKKRVVEICNKLLEKGIKKTFLIFARADSIIACEEIMPLLYRAGFRDMLVGLEAVDDETLKAYNKNSSVAVNKRAVQILRDNKMLCVGLFVINYDFKHKDFMKLNKFIRESGIIWVLFSILIPFKGTEIYSENKDKLYKYKYRRTDGTHVLMNTTGMPKWLFKVEFDFLYYVNYPRIYWAGLTGMFNRKYRNNK